MASEACVPGSVRPWKLWQSCGARSSLATATATRDEGARQDGGSRMQKAENLIFSILEALGRTRVLGFARSELRGAAFGPSFRAGTRWRLYKGACGGHEGRK